MALKESTRKLVLEKRDAIPADQRVKKSQRICDQLTQIALQHVGESSNASRNGLFIAAYEPMRNEVDVHPFFREAFARGWHVCLPCMAKDAESAKARMVFFELSETRIFDERPAFLDHPARPFLLANLHAQGWHEIDEVLFDIAVIPMVAFDSTLMRLGYGGRRGVRRTTDPRRPYRTARPVAPPHHQRLASRKFAACGIICKQNQSRELALRGACLCKQRSTTVYSTCGIAAVTPLWPGSPAFFSQAAPLAIPFPFA